MADRLRSPSEWSKIRSTSRVAPRRVWVEVGSQVSQVSGVLAHELQSDRTLLWKLAQHSNRPALFQGVASSHRPPSGSLPTVIQAVRQ